MAQITIIGLGTVGSSIGLALRRYMNSGNGQPGQFTIVGYDSDRDRQQIALHRDSSIDRAAGDLPSAVRESPFVVLAVPTGQLRETLAAIAPHLPAGATVTDTTAIKTLALGWATELLPTTVNFVGGHPVPRRIPAPTITTDTVVDEPPTATLFDDAPYCIMPLASASESSVNQVIGLAEALGAKPFFTDPLEHDSFVAGMHDLPLLMSFALMGMLSSSPSWSDLGPLAGGAFREATRMASTDPNEAFGHLVANKANLLSWLDRYQVALLELRDLLGEVNTERPAGAAEKKLEGLLLSAHDARLAWLNPKAAPTAQDRLARETAREMQAARPMRQMLGGFLADRFGGGRGGDSDRKDRH